MATKSHTNLTALYAEALAERFTLPKRGKPTEATNWEEPILDTVSDRVGKGMAVFFTADDGALSFRAVTPAEAAEVVAHVRDTGLERLRIQVADYERQLEQLAAELTQIRAGGGDG